MSIEYAINSLGIPVFPIAVDFGGTGVSDIPQNALMVGNGTDPILTIEPGTDGQVLLGGSGLIPAFATLTSTGGTVTFTPGPNSLNLEASGSVAITFDGNSGTATPVANNLDVVVDNSTLSTYASSSTAVFEGATNILSLRFSDSLNNTGIGFESLSSLVGTGGSNTGFGYRSLKNVTSGDDNTAVGSRAGRDIDDGLDNTCIGKDAGLLLSSGDNNILIGSDASTGLLSGDRNVVIGVGTGSSYAAGESSNILISNIGVASENNVIRIGTTGTSAGEQSSCYIAGIESVDVGNVAEVVTIDSDQLGSKTLTAGTGITVTAAATTLTIDAAGGGLTWNEETGTSANMAVNNGYIANNAALVTLTLPSTAAVGEIVRVTGKGAGLYSIAQNAGQTIHFGTSSTTTGAGGSLTATNQYDSIEMVCITADTEWVVISATGNIDVT